LIRRNAKERIIKENYDLSIPFIHRRILSILQFGENIMIIFICLLAQLDDGYSASYDKMCGFIVIIVICYYFYQQDNSNYDIII